MKSMTCKQLGGACDQLFQADSFELIVEQSKQHGKEMFLKQDKAHLEIFNKMKEIMKTPEDIKGWLEIKKKEFNTM